MNILNKRASGVLMPISSLPGKTGIGSFGKEAYKFVDLLKNANQTYWQILPLGPTGYKDSPYQVFSTFAGNPYFINLEFLTEQSYLKSEDWEKEDWGKDLTCVDYGKVYFNRKKVFNILYENFIKNIPEDFLDFCKENDFWLEDYSLFMAIKDSCNGISLTEWNQELRMRNPLSIKKAKETLKDECSLYKMLQYFFYKQWYALKSYANNLGIKIIGDLPIYVSGDSSDVWANPELFNLDKNRKPLTVAGCPPDSFSKDGQLWGNPIYNWENHKKTDYEWWKKRISFALKMYDVCRLDHFRGFESYYSIPYGDKNAVNGKWCKGPGMDLFNSIKKTVASENFIAEDLGFLTPEVHKLLEDSAFPGMKILQFAFDSREENDYLPEHYTENCVVYTGTHDNETILGWAEKAPQEDVKQALKYFNIEDISLLPNAMMTCALMSKANTCILCAQDLLKLGSSARINTPSTSEGNWCWRASSEQLDSMDFDFLKETSIASNRFVCNA